jgi:hypothetical protein
VGLSYDVCWVIKTLLKWEEMRRFIKVEAGLVNPRSFRGKLKEGLKRCLPEAKEYHACVTKYNL